MTEKNVAFILTSHAELGSSGAQTGSWLSEIAAPYYVFAEAGVKVTLASVAGGPAPLEPVSLEDQWCTDEAARLLKDADAMAQVENTVKLADLDPDQIDAVYLVGGAGTVWDFPDDEKLKMLVEKIYADGGVVAGVCHGVIGLARCKGGDGHPLLRGRQVTCISNMEDEMAGYDKILPAMPENVLRKLGSYYSAAAPFGKHVIIDGQIMTGQNPVSAGPLAEAVLRHIS